jgi:O-antigen ligase
MTEYVQRERLDPATVRIHAHAHNSLLHIGATTGTIGVLLALGILLMTLRGGFSELGPQGLSGYAAGPAFALIGLLLVSAFDPVHLNAQTAALVATLMAMSLVSRPVSPPPAP